MCSLKYITLEEEMKKNPELKMSDIQILKEWCGKQPHLPKIQDVELAIFLHSNYYQLEPTKSTIENYYTIRTHVPEFFSNRDIIKVKRVRKIFDVLGVCCLEKSTKEDYNIIMGKLVDFEPSHYDLNDAIKCGFMILDEFIWTHGSTPGFVFISDATGVSFGHVARMNPMSLKKLAYYIQNAFPVRLMAIHILNTSPVIEILFNMMKPFLKTEMLQLINFHSSMESASRYLPIEALPKEYGGKAGPFQDLINTCIKKVENFREWFLEDEKINRVNESLRIGQSNISNDLFDCNTSRCIFTHCLKVLRNTFWWMLCRTRYIGGKQIPYNWLRFK